MRRAAIVAFALLASLLVATAVPVSASSHTNTAVGSNNTDDTDFNNATTLANLTVQGTGNSASVVLQTTGDQTIDHFNDGSIGDYSGDTAEFAENSNAPVIEGTGSLKGTPTNGNERIVSTSGLNAYPSQGDNFSVLMHSDSSDPLPSMLFGVQNNTHFYAAEINTATNEIAIFKDGLTGTDQQASTSASVSTGTWYEAAVEWNSSGGINYHLYNVDQSTGARGSEVASISIVDNDYSSGGIGWGVGSSSGTAAYDDANILGDDFNSGTYVGQAHDVDDPQSGFTNFTNLNNVSIEVTWQENSAGTWSDIRTDTYTTGGNKTVDISSATDDEQRVNVTVTETGDNPTFNLTDEGVLFTNHQPEVDNSSASPTGTLNQADQTLSIDVSDTEFPKAQGDSVTATFSVDGNTVGTDTLTSNGTASVSHTFSGGSHDWSVTVDDDYGLSNTSQTFTVKAPGNLTVRAENPSHEPVTGVTADAIFYETVDDDPTIQNLTADANGNISMEGLPTDTQFAVRLSASGFHNRTVLIENIFTQSDVFLLDRENTASEVVFSIEDPTGQFTSADSTIVVQRAINESIYNGTGGFSWMTIAGDRTGASNELPVTLEEGVRYRLRVTDGSGDVRVVGAYTVTGTDSVTLRPTAPSINITDVDTFEWNATQVNTSSGARIEFEYADPDDDTTDLDVFIYEVGNQSNSFPVQTVSGPIGYTKITQSLTAEQAEKNWKVEWNATKGGEEINATVVVGQQTQAVLTDVAPWIRNAIAIFITVLTGALFGVVNAKTGGVVTALVAGGFWMGGWLPNAAGGAIMIAFVIAIMWKAADSRVG